MLLGAYVLSSLACVVVHSYVGLLAARVATATSQAVFWSVVVPVAAGLFLAAVRGRVLSMVIGGGTLAVVAGVPAGTWLGQHLGWRWAFAALGLLGAAALVAVAAWLPDDDPGAAGTEWGPAPDRRRFVALLGVTALVSTGAFTFFTYLSPFLTDTALLSAGLLSLVLLIRGLAGLGGVALAGPLVDARPRLAIALPVALQVAALLLLAWRPRDAVLVVVLVGVTGFAWAGFSTPLSSRMMEVAPGRVDLAMSGTSTAVNVGITVGALAGSALLDGPGPRATALVGGLFTAVALALLTLDRSDRRPRRVRPPPGPPGGERIPGGDATTAGLLPLASGSRAPRRPAWPRRRPRRAPGGSECQFGSCGAALTTWSRPAGPGDRMVGVRHSRMRLRTRLGSRAFAGTGRSAGGAAGRLGAGRSGSSARQRSATAASTPSGESSRSTAPAALSSRSARSRVARTARARCGTRPRGMR